MEGIIVDRSCDVLKYHVRKTEGFGVALKRGSHRRSPYSLY